MKSFLHFGVPSLPAKASLRSSTRGLTVVLLLHSAVLPMLASDCLGLLALSPPAFSSGNTFRLSGSLAQALMPAWSAGDFEERYTNVRLHYTNKGLKWSNANLHIKHRSEPQT